MWLAVIYNFRLALLRESDGANKHGAAVARGGISPMSSSPTYSDALHCEQKKWRHYHHYKSSVSQVSSFLCQTGSIHLKVKVKTFAAEWILSSQCSVRSQPDKVFPALLSQRSSSQAAVGGFCVWLQSLEDVRQRREDEQVSQSSHSNYFLCLWFKEISKNTKRGEKWRSVPSKYSTFPGQPIQWWRCFQARQGRISEFF